MNYFCFVFCIIFRPIKLKIPDFILKLFNKSTDDTTLSVQQQIHLLEPVLEFGTILTDALSE